MAKSIGGVVLTVKEHWQILIDTQVMDESLVEDINAS